MTASQSPQRPLPAALLFPCASISGMLSWTFVHPFDLLKTQCQVASHQRASTGELVSGRSVARELLFGTRFDEPNPRTYRRILRMYDGFSAGLARCGSYSALMVASHEWLKQRRAAAVAAGTQMDWSMAAAGKVVDGVLCGVIAALVCCPVDVCLVRMQSDAQIRDPSQRRRYRHVLDAAARVVREEGALTLWRGGAPLVARAAGAGLLQVACYDAVKDAMSPVAASLWNGGGASQQEETVRFRWGHYFLSSAATGVLYGYGTMPLESMKIRMMYQLKAAAPSDAAISNTTTAADGTGLKYPNLRTTFRTVLREEGVRGFYRGVGPYVLRCVVSTITYFMIYEEVKRAITG